MIYLKIENVKPGMLLGQSIYSNNQVLLTEKTMLTASYISRLKRLGISGIYIANHIDEDLQIYDIISRKTRREIASLAEKTLTQVKQPQDFTSSLSASIRNVIDTVIQELMSSNDLTINLYTIKTFSDYLFNHSVNVCLYSIIIGIARGYGEKKLMQLGVGAFLHDLGKLQIPTEILDKPSKLTAEEFKEIQLHPKLGYDILKKSGEIDYTSASVIYQHHEKLNGSGYPKQLDRDRIHEFSRIVAIADIYDAITSNRVYNKAMPNHEAIQLILSYASQELDEELVSLFLTYVPAFPLGTYAHLNNQLKGVVIGQNKEAPLRPLLLIDKEGEREVKPFELDLSKELALTIIKTS